MSLFLVFAAACGGDDSSTEADACLDVECARGVCLDGACTNSDACTGDDACLAGYQCSGGVCVVTEVCEADGTCQRGVCQSGACVNPATCSANDECVSDYFCDEGACAPDPCASTTCDRGICEIGTGECVNASTCTSGNEEVVCLEGNRCQAGDCVDEETFCAGLDCPLGVCDFEAGECVDAASCTENTQCLEGSYCADDGACKLNLCDAQMTDCELGVCDPTNGDCVNAETCDSLDDCVNGSVCVADTCVDAATACGEAGCPGNQLCEYDAGARSATCLENAQEACTSALDCTGERVCAAGACADPSACVPDAYEPNDAAADATAFQSEAASNRLSASLCAGDVDLYLFDTIADEDEDGTLLVHLTIPPEALGLGVLSVELLGPDGSSVATARSEAGGAPSTTARIEYAVDATNDGVYTVSVGANGQLSSAGVDYDLIVDLVSASTVTACTNVSVINGAGTINGDTTTAATSSLTSSCLDADGSLNEDVYELVVPQDSYATIRLLPNSAVDVGISIRSTCTQNISELSNGCADAGGNGDVEELEMQLLAGSYFLVVEPYTTGSGGAYTISVALEAMTCTPADNSCTDASTANMCNPRGTGFDTVTCEAGCDAATGSCSRLRGDVCASAIPVDASTGFVGTVDYRTLANDYDPGDGACVPENSNSSTDGPDAVFVVTVPAGDVVVANVESPGVRYVAAYVVEDCADVVTSCLGGANDGGYSGADEVLVWHNETGSPKTVYVIADSEDYSSTSSYSGIGDVEIRVDQFVCTPGANRCAGPNNNRESQTCNASGTAWSTTTPCENGCDQSTGQCAVAGNDTCGGATVLVSGVPVRGELALLNDDYQAGSCGDLSSFDNGLDAVYLLQGVTAGSLIELKLETSDFDPAMWISRGCTAESLDACADGFDSSETDGTTEEHAFVADGDDYYVIVEEGDTDEIAGAFTLTATITPPVCTPGDFLGCNTAATALEYCDNQGQIVTYTCNGSCDPTSNTCGVPSGDICNDAVVVTNTSGQLAGGWASGTNSLEPQSGTYAGSCYFGSRGYGPETFYRFDLQAGQKLRANVQADTSASMFYLLPGSCSGLDTCWGHVDNDGDDYSIEYIASQNEPVFLVVDRAGAATSTYTWTVDYNITTSTQVCVPNTTTCYDQFAVERCNADGTMATQTICANGCQNGYCQEDAALTDSCASAPDIGSGGYFYVDMGAHTPTADIDDSANCDLDADGPDAFFTVSLQADDVLHVTGIYAPDGSQYDDAVVYVFTSCDDVGGTCMGAAESVIGQDLAQLYYQSPIAQTVYVGVDTDSSFDSDGMVYAIEILAPQCDDSDPVACDGSGNSLVYCESGLLQSFACGGGCQSDACVVPSGDACFDAFTLTGTSGTIEGDWVGNTDRLKLDGGQQGACLFDNGPLHGAEDIFEVDLAAGELLELTLDSTESSSLLYVLEDCLEPIASCAAGDDSSSPHRVSYYADQARTVFVVVDRDDTATDNSYILTYAISTGSVCNPGQSVCADANTVAVCNEEGSALRGQYNCAGGCSNGFCDPQIALADSCSTAPVLTDGTRLVVDYDQFTNDIDLSEASCVGDDTPAGDAFYQVALQADQILHVTATSYGLERAAVYVFMDCSAAEGSCLTGANGLPTAEVYYQASTAETVFVGIDATFSSYDEPTLVDVEVLTPDCDPASHQRVCNAEGTAVAYCDELGLIREYACQGVGTCTSGRCDEPVGEVCFDAFDGNPSTGATSVVLNGLLADFTNDYDLPVGNMCTGSITPAADSVYVVDLTAGQTLTASLLTTATAPEDLALYITPTCDDIAGWCVAGADAVDADGATPETATYTATTDETLYVIVDSFFGSSDGEYQLTLDVQ